MKKKEKTKMAKIKRLSKKYEPTLHVHRYIVVLIKDGNKKYKYCVNLKEVQALKNDTSAGYVIEVFKAQHNFVAAFYKG